MSNDGLVISRPGFVALLFGRTPTVQGVKVNEWSRKKLQKMIYFRLDKY